MAYRIMLAKKKASNYGSLYQFMTTTIDSVVYPYELDTKDELDAKIEDMLESGDYSKSDFIVVEVIDYTIDATDYTDDEDEEEDTEDTTDSTEDTTE